MSHPNKVIRFAWARWRYAYPQRFLSLFTKYLLLNDFIHFVRMSEFSILILMEPETVSRTYRQVMSSCMDMSISFVYSVIGSIALHKACMTVSALRMRTA